MAILLMVIVVLTIILVAIDGYYINGYRWFTLEEKHVFLTSFYD
jgi:hypothetical protein